MKFKLREKTPKEMDLQKESIHYFPEFKAVCPYEVCLGLNVIDLWKLNDEGIVTVIQTAISEDNQTKDLFKALDLWLEKRKDYVSVDMIEELFALKKENKDKSKIINKCLNILAGKRIEDAKIIADYLKGMQGDENEIVDANILKVLQNQEKIKQNRIEKGITN